MDSFLRFSTFICLLAMGSLCHARELLAVGAHFERVFERGSDGDFRGMGVDIVREVARRNGDTVRFASYPWARAQAMVAAGAADILIGPYRTPERMEKMAFSRSAFYRDDMLFYALADSGIQWKGDYRALAEQPIVIMNGWVYGARFDAARPALRLSVANNVENGVRMLTYRHVTLFASNRRNTEPVLAALGIGDKVRPLRHVIEVQDGYFAFPRDAAHEPLRRRFDAALDALVASGELRRLGQQHDVDIP